MAGDWRTVRVFLSSTFRDMHAERDHLIKVTFPRVRQWCAQRRLFFVDIDLRWGVTRQEANEGKAIEICLKEIDGARPFFLCFLGERYGWVPDELPPEELYGFRGKQAETHLSITHLEILHAIEGSLALHAGNRKPPCAQAFFYFRKASCLPPPEEVPERDREYFRSTFFEPPPARPDMPNRHDMLVQLKTLIRKRFAALGQDHVFDYGGQWDPDADNPEDEGLRGRLTRLDRLGERVEADLKRGIASAFAGHIARQGRADPLAEEQALHEAFVENRLQVYTPRHDLECELSKYLNDDDPRPLLLVGPPGSGKSSVLAHWTGSLPPDVFAIVRFIGASSGSTQLSQLIGSLCAQLIQHLGLSELPPDVQNLSETLQKWQRLLIELAEKRRVLIVLDAVNQLDRSAEPARLTAWLPQRLPGRTKLVLSALTPGAGETPSPWLEALRRLGVRELHVPAMTIDDCRQIIHDVPSIFCKTLDPNQAGRLLANPATRNPLFLRVALEELRVFGSFDKLDAEIDALPQVAEDRPDEIDKALDELFARVLARLERETRRRAPGLVRAVFRWLAVAREGMLESELTDLLRAALPGFDAEERAGTLQVVLRQVRPYLMAKAHPQGALWDFYHRSFWKAVCRKYLPDADAALREQTHAEMARFFEGQPTQLSGGDVNVRRVAELPVQQRAARRWRGFVDTVLAGDFIDASCRIGLAADLAEQIRGAYASLANLDSATAGEVLHRLAGFLAGSGGPEHPVFNLDALHSWIGYRSEKRLYLDLLKRGSAQVESEVSYAVKCASYYAEMLRRQGQLDLARDLFHRIRSVQETRKAWQDLSRTWYGLAYISFLRGDFDEAARTFQQSVGYAENAADLVGAAISRCLEGRARYLGAADESSRANFRRVLLEAEEIFEDRARGANADPRAERWVMNVRAHCFEIAFDEGDSNEAARLLQVLEADPWVQTFRGELALLTYRARLLMLQANWERAVDQFQESQEIEEAAWSVDTEGAARQWLDLGRSLRQCGWEPQAKKAWEAGLKCLDDRGNRVWKRRIEAMVSS
jgi:tetratricopeptide (TPR) repeat protein